MTIMDLQSYTLQWLLFAGQADQPRHGDAATRGPRRGPHIDKVTTSKRLADVFLKHVELHSRRGTRTTWRLLWFDAELRFEYGAATRRDRRSLSRSATRLDKNIKLHGRPRRGPRTQRFFEFLHTVGTITQSEASARPTHSESKHAFG